MVERGGQGGVYSHKPCRCKLLALESGSIDSTPLHAYPALPCHGCACGSKPVADDDTRSVAIFAWSFILVPPPSLSAPMSLQV